MATRQAIKFQSKSFTIYRDRSGMAATEKQLSVLRQNWSAIEYNGFLSKGTRRKIMNMLNCWAECIYCYNQVEQDYDKKRDRRLRFLTLTLPERQTITDNEIKRRILVPFIQELKSLFHVEHYFWRAEAQQNGNIHFHLIVDKYLDKERVNYIWDNHCYNGDQLSFAPVWHEKYHSASTRIEAIQGNEAVAGYVTKYVVKDDGGRKIFGRIWGCSDKLRDIAVPSIVFTNEVAAEITNIERSVKYEIHKTDLYIIHKIDLLRDKRIIDSWLVTDLFNFYVDQYFYLYNINILERWKQ